jgi:ABC-type transport system involved in multi-copper enzyme maturation permease subunit
VLGPIFNREFLTVPRRTRHYFTRVAYLGTLWIISVTAWLATVGWTRTATLGEIARFGPLLFQVLTFVQLALFLFFAALAAASAVALEKDRRTFVLLLMTDLYDYEIVLGKLLGSLLPIVLLLAGTIPLLMLIVLLGGVAFYQVIQAVVIVAATALAAGSLGGLIALWREKTFQSLALTVLFLVLYVCLVRGLGVVPGLTAARAEQLQLWLDPFQALRGVQQPDETAAAILPPAYVFALIMLGVSVLLNIWGILFLRVWNPSGEPIMQREQPDDETAQERAATATLEALRFAGKGDAKQAVVARFKARRDIDDPTDTQKRTSVHAAPGKVRQVGANPILWREIVTRAYGRRPLLVKFAYAIVLALICYYALAPLVLHGERAAFTAAYGMIPIGVLSLLLVAAQASTAITSERDIGALDLLLVTDLTPQEFIFGKLGGIAYNAKEFLLPPLLLAGVYAYYGCLASPPANHPELARGMNITSLMCVIGSALVLLAFAMVLGIHVALRTMNSRFAIINTLSTIFFLSVGTLVCIALILINGRFEYQWGSFILFIVAGIGGLWWVLSGNRPSAALTVASWLCPLSVFYTVANILVAKPGTQESADPLIPFLVIAGAFGFTVAAMLVPLLSEFDVALGRTSGGAD